MAGVGSQNTSPTVNHIFDDLTAPYFLQSEANHGIIMESSEKSGKMLDVYEAHLSKNKYVGGDFREHCGPLAFVLVLPSL